MANPEHLTAIYQGAEYWNTWRKQYPEILPDLSQRDLRGINLSGANLANIDFSYSDLSNALLVNV
ncbi:MAG: pentapeptide repeat-containing protein, partial [Microcoleaceae cyanobacterium]